EVRMAAVADRDLGQQRVEAGVDQRRDEQAGIEGREGCEGRPHDHDRDAGLLVEVALHVELLALTGRAAVHDAPLAERSAQHQWRRRLARAAASRAGEPGHGFAAARRAAERDLRAAAHNASPAVTRRYLASSSPARTRKSCTYKMPVAAWVDRISTVFQMNQTSESGPAIPNSRRIQTKTPSGLHS